MATIQNKITFQLNYCILVAHWINEKRTTIVNSPKCSVVLANFIFSATSNIYWMICIRHWICGALYSKPNRSYSLCRNTPWISSAYSVNHHCSLNKCKTNFIVTKLYGKSIKCKTIWNTFQIACQCYQIKMKIKCC